MFWRWIQIFRAVLADEDLRDRLGDGAEDVAMLVPEYFARRRRPRAAIPVLPDEARFRLFDGLVTTLKAAAARRPLIVVLDDLHFADAASLALLEFVAHEIPATRMLVAAADRDSCPQLEPAPAPRRRGTRQRDLLAGVSANGVARVLELSIGERVSESAGPKGPCPDCGEPILPA